MELAELFYRFGVALVLGALPGLEREYSIEGKASPPSEDRPAGARTFALMSLVGCAAAFAGDETNSAVVFAAIFLAMCALVIAGYLVSAKHRTGMTTETAGILILVIGAMCYWNEITLAGALSVTMTVLLSVKGQVQNFVKNLKPEDVHSTLIFAVITVIILPVLPNEGIGEAPFDVLNPRRIWLMVVFISGISFLGYILNKILGTNRGIILSGILGGMASSTASTLSFAHRSKENPELSKSFALAIMLAWTVMYARMGIIVFVINQDLLKKLWLPLLINGLVGVVYAAWLYYSSQKEYKPEDVQYANPFRLRPALQFGAMYALVLFFSRWAQIEFGDTGVYLSSIFSGLVDVNAITLSVADLAEHRSIGTVLAAQAIILAGISNTIFKGSAVFSNSAPNLRKPIMVGVILLVAAGIAVMFLI